MCFGHYLLIQNQTSDGSPCECLANSGTCYFPSVEYTHDSFTELIMSRNVQTRGGDPLPDIKPISFPLKMTVLEHYALKIAFLESYHSFSF